MKTGSERGRNTDETEIARAAFSGDRKAFGRLVERYENPVYNMCLRYVGFVDASDLAQETFIRAFVKRERFSVEKSVLPWLLAIARNLCIDRIRRRRREPDLRDEISDTAGNTAETIEQGITSRQLVEKLEEGLRVLPQGQREAFLLFHVEGLAYREIADVMDIPDGTVMTWIHRARKALEKRLEEFNSSKGRKV